MPTFRPVATSLTILSVLMLSTFSFAAAPDRITGALTAGQTVRLTSGVPLQARPEFDQGLVDPSLRMSYITLLTKPTPAQQKAITRLLADQQNPHSASYHKWLTPEQYADRFGLSPNDVKKITDWLQSAGFTVVKTARGRNWIVFSGTAAQVERTFQTELRNFKVKGENHFANTMPPVIPAALSGIVTGIRGFNNFRAQSQARRAKSDYSITLGGTPLHFIAPGDIATMYDLNTLYSQGFDGTGQRLAVIGQTDVYLADLADFRSGFGLSAINCTTSGTNVITSCNTSNFKYVLISGDTDPGAPDSIGDDLPEADIDLEWSGATARNAQIIYVNAPDPNGSGVYDSMYDAIDNNRAPVMTMSYSFPCELAEAEFGTYTADEAEFQKANLHGITFMNSSGDTGVAECDFGNSTAVFGYAAAYPASSPSITGVGGTLIPWDEYTGTYWNTTNGTDGGSAKQYIPENVWSDAQEWSIFCTDNPSQPTCANNPGLDSWQTAQETYIGLWAGGGGVSNCVVIDGNGVCQSGFPQPTWQASLNLSAVNPSGAGQTTTPTRLSPDVSLLASIYWPGYIICTADSELGGIDNNSACSPGGAQGIINNMTNFGFSWGGTSISSPIFAGIVSMLNQFLNGSTNTGLGNINPTLYTLAATPSNGAFHPLTTGNNGAWCTPGTPSSGVSGDPWPAALVCPSSGPNTAFIGFDASNSDPTTGYNLAVGLGSVKASNLFNAWSGAGLSSTTTTVVSSKNPSILGDSVTFTATVTTTGTNTPTGTVTFKDGNSQIGTGALGGPGVINSATATFTTSALAVGSHSITGVYGGDANNAGSTSPVLTQTVDAPDFSLTNTGASTATVLAGQTTGAVYSFAVVPLNGQTTFAATVNFACSFTPSDPTLTNSSCTFNPASIAAGSPASAGSNITVSITTAGPNQNGPRGQQRRRADNRMPWLPLTLPLAGVVLAGFAGRKRSKYSVVGSLCLALVLAGLLVACGGNGTPGIGVTVSQGNPASLFPNNPGPPWPSQTANFTATVSNDSQNMGVTWAASSGSIASTGALTATYTAPDIVAGLPSSVTITATSVADTSKSGTGRETLNPATVPGTYTMTVTVTESTSSHNLAPAPKVVVQ